MVIDDQDDYEPEEADDDDGGDSAADLANYDNDVNLLDDDDD
jgi:hypothetical protein